MGLIRKYKLTESLTKPMCMKFQNFYLKVIIKPNKNFYLNVLKIELHILLVMLINYLFSP